MSTTAKIDFEPGLFDEGQTEAAPELWDANKDSSVQIKSHSLK
ncbi:hypothetical protein AFAE65S_04275 [Alcaligenes phenolicus]